MIKSVIFTRPWFVKYNRENKLIFGAIVAAKEMEFKKGDYLVHSNYGVGKIVKIESKSIGEEKLKSCCFHNRNK